MGPDAGAVPVPSDLAGERRRDGWLGALVREGFSLILSLLLMPNCLAAAVPPSPCPACHGEVFAYWRCRKKAIKEHGYVYLNQWFSTFLVPRHVTPNIKLFSLLLYNCNFTVMNLNANICVFRWSLATPVKGLFDFKGVGTHRLKNAEQEVPKKKPTLK